MDLRYKERRRAERAETLLDKQKSIRIKAMQNLKVNSNYPTRLYGSAVVEGREKASSLYQKRTEYDIPALVISDNKPSQEFYAPYRKYSNEEISHKVTTGKASHLDYSLGKNKNDGYGTTAGGYAGREVKAPGKYVPSTDRPKYNQNQGLGFVPARRKNEVVDVKKDPLGINQGGDDYARIVEKLNKKGKIIQQLQKLCDNKVSDNLRSPQSYHKSTYEVYSPVRTKAKHDQPVSINIIPADSKLTSSDKVSTSSTFNVDLSKSEAFERVHHTNNPSFLNGLRVEEVKKPERTNSGANIVKANPEDSKETWRKISSAYSSPREAASKNGSTSKYGDKGGENSKPLSFMDKFTAENSSKVAGNSQKTISDMNFCEEVQSPVVTKRARGLQQSKQYKHSKDIRQIMEVKKIKNSGIFSNKKVSIHDFDLQKKLGEGKFGTVYQAFHKETNGLFALKKISKEVIKSNLMIDQLLQQIKIQIFCNHENILKLYGFFDDAEHIYLILEYMEEGTLFTHLKINKTLKEEDAKLKLKDIAKAVIYLHEEGIAHRDIKPENIVMTNGIGKLCDFGWAAICTDRRKTYCGTFDYVAPEILEGSDYDASVDLWCLGVLAYELLVGKAPFYHISRKETMKKIMKVDKLQFPPHVTPTAVSFIESLIKKNPQQRLNGQGILRHQFLSTAGRQTI